MCPYLNYAHLVRFVPSWFPGAGFQKWAADGRADYATVRDRPYEFVKNEMVLTIPMLTTIFNRIF